MDHVLLLGWALAPPGTDGVSNIDQSEISSLKSPALIVNAFEEPAMKRHASSTAGNRKSIFLILSPPFSSGFKSR
jgi:hypothetical protein